ncbi:hypothetical protein [Marinobacter nauticus]|nr:hypothetical protein [Marinobacter nauticus]ABM20805.1 hypothetical protein Maqu_3736 [Marinobacter nauticus VT8]MAP31508.1 hypothetical protein [Marinobacter sp.]MCC4271131.1 hypothetical protein [Marinobacter nauticus]MEC8898893.1 hypothetical protein [Pseudomonadota bacterium]
MNARKQTEGKRAGAALLALPLMLLMALPAYAQSEDDAAFEYEERSTIDTIPFRSVAEEELANTVIEGGLAAPAAGVPVQQATDDDFYLDPLALQPRDPRTDLGRSEIPVEIRFSNPKVIPGQSHGNNYVIRPPENRTYDTLNTNLTGR